jgi:hypothetical protein
MQLISYKNKRMPNKIFGAMELTVPQNTLRVQCKGYGWMRQRHKERKTRRRKKQKKEKEEEVSGRREDGE